MAIALNHYDPDRFKLGFTYEYHHGVPDLGYSEYDFDQLSKSEKQRISLNSENWALVHAYVQDTKTGKWLDARGEHNSAPHLYSLNTIRKEIFPATQKQLIDTMTYMSWNESDDKWDIIRGKEFADMFLTNDSINHALDFAKHNLNI